MKGTHLGEFEELVLLTSAVLDGNAYTVSIVDRVAEDTGRKLTLSATHTALVRLENKGFLKSDMGGTTQERGGRRRRLYRITAAGYKALNDVKEVRARMWQGMPKFGFDFSA